MANTSLIKRSSVASKVPTTSDLSLGELAVNTYDGKLFLKKSVSGTESIVDLTDADTLDGQHGSYYTGYTDTAIANLIDSAPNALNTLNELSAALNDDASFSTTITNSIATKMPLAGGQFTGDVTFNSGANAILIAANSDIRFANGSNWTGDVTGKIQLFNNTFYISGGTGGIIFREGGTSRWRIDGDGHFIPINGDGLLDIGTNTVRVRNGYFDNLYGNGSNLTNIPAAQLTGVLPALDGSNLTGLTVDNAQTLDNLDSTQFVRSDANDTTTGTLAFTTPSAFPVNINGSHDAKIHLQGSNNPYIQFTESTSYNRAYIQWSSSADTLIIANEQSGEQIKLGSGNNGLEYRVDNANQSIFHQGNDGSGSGLDADTLDGVQGSSYLRSDTTDTFTGNEFTFSSSADQKIILQGATNPYIRFKEGTTNKAYIQWSSGGNFYIVNQETGEQVYIGSSSTGLKFVHDGTTSTVWHSGNDGTGSGLDADTLDGQQASAFLGVNATANNSNALKIVDTRNDGARVPNDYAGHKVTSEFTNQINNGWWSTLTVKGWADGYAPWQLIGKSDTGQSSNLFVRFGHGQNNTWSSQFKIWHEGVDGSGSTLDADTLDGVEGSSYLRSDTADTASGDITFSGGSGAITLAANSDITFGTSGSWSGEKVKLQHHGNTLYMQGGTSGINLRGSDGGTIATFQNTAVRFYDPVIITDEDIRSNGTSNWTGNLGNDIGKIQMHSNRWYIVANGNSNRLLQLRQDGTDKSWFANDGQLYHGDNSTNDKYWRQGNDGSGSGLDADLWDGNQFASYLDQAVLTSSTVNFARVNVTGSHGMNNDGWFRNTTSGEGLYNNATTQHFYSDDDDYWNIAGGGSANGLRFRDEHAGTIRGYVYANNSNQIGFLNQSAAWTLRTETNGITRIGSNGYQLVDGNVAQNLKYIAGANTSDIGISGYNSGGTWKFQLYGATNYYGFLNANWGGWDIRKNIGGQLQISVSGTLYTAWHNGNDGAGTGLDSDKLDGEEGSYYLDYNNFSNTPTIPSAVTNNNQLTNGAGYITSADGGNAATVDNLDASQFLRSDSNDTFTKGSQTIFDGSYSDWLVRFQNNNGTNAQVYMCHHNHGMHVRNDSSTTGTYLLDVYAANGNRFMVRGADALVTSNGNTMWHAGNDGSGSSLDADTLDGIQAARFLTSYSSSSTTGWEDSNRNFRVNTGGNAAGLVFHEQDGTFAFQIYGDGSTYGFLDGNWAAWDIQKSINGHFKVDEGSGLQRVWNAGNDGSGTGLDADTLDGTQANALVRSGQQSSVSGWHISAYRNGSGTSPHIYMSHSSGYGFHVNTYNTSGSYYAIETHNGTKTTFVVWNDGRCQHGGNVEPNLDGQYNLGSSSNRWANLYINDLQLSNEGSANDVDGTWGSYTIQEGKDSLYLINKRNGKKYKFNLTEVS